MKKIIITLISLYTYSCVEQKNDSLVIDFRTVPISNGQKLTLQSNISTIKDIAIQGRPEHYYLKKGTFAGCDSIDVEVNNENKIIALSFFYDSTYTYKEQIETFTEKLHKGKEIKDVEVLMKVTKWQDRLTTFEIIERTNSKGKKTIYSAMFDKELFFKKIPAAGTPTFSESSFEILRALNVF
jgi:hypothetical protein